MSRTLIILAASLAVAACADADGGRGGNAGVSANQQINNATIGGNVSNNAGNANAGGGGAGGTATNTVSVNLALDPSTFASLFGNIPKVASPTSAQVQRVSDYAASLQAKAAQCQSQLNSCEITKGQ